MTEFQRYLSRFQRLVGAIDVGQYGRFKDRLLRKLCEKEFTTLCEKHQHLGGQMPATMESGDTIDESLLLEIRRTEFDLLIEESKYIL